MVYQRRGSSKYWITVPTRTVGEYAHLTTGTRDKATAEAMEAMWKLLGPSGKRQWDLIDAVLEGRCRLADLYDAYVADAKDHTSLDQLRARLADVDLAVGVGEWDAQLERQYRGETPRKYRHHVAALFPRGEDGKYLPAPRSRVLAPGYIAGVLKTVSGSNTNRRRHHDAWTSVFDYLKQHGHVAANPMRDVTKPEKDKSKTPHLDRLEDVLRLIHAFPEGPHRAAAALREGAGMEMQSIMPMRMRDIENVEQRVVWAHGEKNVWRDRQVLVDPECWEIFYAYVRAGRFHRDALLFPISDDSHRYWHRKACAALRKLGFTIPAGYTPHAARHTYAIRKMRANVEATLIANNLGHADTHEVLDLYGKYRPMITDIIRAGQPRAKGE